MRLQVQSETRFPIAVYSGNQSSIAVTIALLAVLQLSRIVEMLLVIRENEKDKPRHPTRRSTAIVNGFYFAM